MHNALHRTFLFFVAIALQAAAFLAIVQVAKADAAAANLWEPLPTGVTASLRGLSTPSDDTIWACGSDATVIRSIDGGKTWKECGPQEFGKLEFRSIHAWDTDRVCIASAGTPAVVLMSADGGQTWQETFRVASPEAFFDGMKFWDEQRGILFGDPIDGRLFVAQTSDGGRSWQVPANDLPQAFDGEAGFAASNSALAVAGPGSVWIGTGGADRPRSRIYRRATWDSGWEAATCPLPSGPASGVFSVAKSTSLKPDSKSLLVAVGGDYRIEETSLATAAWSADDGRTWTLASKPPSSFRSAVMWSSSTQTDHEGFLATGPQGTEFSADGQQWTSHSQVGFHVLAQSPSKIFAAGSEGRVSMLSRNDLSNLLRSAK